MKDQFSIGLFEQGGGVLGKGQDCRRMVDGGLDRFWFFEFVLTLREVVKIVVFFVFFVVVVVEGFSLKETEGAVRLGLISHLTNI